MVMNNTNLEASDGAYCDPKVTLSVMTPFVCVAKIDFREIVTNFEYI